MAVKRGMPQMGSSDQVVNAYAQNMPDVGGDMVLGKPKKKKQKKAKMFKPKKMKKVF